jgi:SHS2 domain-containing protein
MPYRYLEEEATADVAFEAWGESLEEVFRASAEATLNVMIEDVESVTARESVPIELSNEALDLLLFDFLQRLIYYKDVDQLLLRVPELQFQRDDETWALRAVARGERLDPERHQQIVDVKAVTFHGFRLEERDGKWQAHVLLDI